MTAPRAFTPPRMNARHDFPARRIGDTAGRWHIGSDRGASSRAGGHLGREPPARELANQFTYLSGRRRRGPLHPRRPASR